MSRFFLPTLPISNRWGEGAPEPISLLAFPTSLRRRDATSLPIRMLTFHSQVIAKANFDHQNVCEEKIDSCPFVFLRGSFALPLLCALCVSVVQDSIAFLPRRMSTFPTEVTAITNSNLQPLLPTSLHRKISDQKAKIRNLREAFPSHPLAITNLTHSNLQPLLPTSLRRHLTESLLLSQLTAFTIFTMQVPAFTVFTPHHDSRSERLLWGNQLVAGLTVKRFVITVVQTLGSPKFLRALPLSVVKDHLERFSEESRLFPRKYLISSHFFAAKHDPSPAQFPPLANSPTLLRTNTSVYTTVRVSGGLLGGQHSRGGIGNPQKTHSRVRAKLASKPRLEAGNCITPRSKLSCRRGVCLEEPVTMIMRKFVKTAFFATVLVFNCAAQQQPQPQFQQRLNQIVRSPESTAEPRTQNLQLELAMSRGGKTAHYRMAFNGGQVSTDLLDKLSEPGTNAEPKTISFSLSFAPFEDGGGEASVFVGRNITYKVKTPTRGDNPDREVVQQKTMGLTTKVALRPGKPVVIFDDEHEKITLKLTEL